MSTIQILDLSAIRADASVQSRAETHPRHMRDFSEAMLRGDDFPPVTTFFDGETYWLADGFHRYGARKAIARVDRRFEGIKAEVREGSKLDAMVFSAGANQNFSIPRTGEDIRRAVFMLRALPEWAEAPNKKLAAHVGTTINTSRKYTEAYFAETGAARPLVLTSKGLRIPATTTPGIPQLRHDKKKGFVTRYKGKLVTLGRDESAAREKIAELSGPLVAKLDDESAVRQYLGPIVEEMRRRGLAGMTIERRPVTCGLGYVLTIIREA